MCRGQPGTDRRTDVRPRPFLIRSLSAAAEGRRVVSTPRGASAPNQPVHVLPVPPCRLTAMVRPRSIPLSLGGVGARGSGSCALCLRTPAGIQRAEVGRGGQREGPRGGEARGKDVQVTLSRKSPGASFHARPMHALKKSFAERG